MTTREEIIALRNGCDEFAEQTLQCKGEFHPDYHTVSDERFYTIAREAGASRRDAEIEEYASVLLKIRKTLCGSINNTDDILELAATVKQERDQLRAELAEARAEIADLKRKLVNEQARDIHSCHPNCTREGCVNRRLRAELVKALAACKAKDEALRHLWNERTPDSYDEAGAALAIQPDTSALEAIVKKAGEVMRERCINVAWNNEPDCNGPIEMGIRALPAVTFDDLKGGA